jgi:hypothetical protein
MSHAGTIVSLPIDSILVGGTRLPVGDECAAAFARSIEARGQLVPILVRQRGNRVKNGPQPYELIDGLLRLEAIRRLGTLEIAAIVADCTEDGQHDIDVAANLERRHGTVLSLAIYVGERKRHAVDRRKFANIANSLSWAEDVAQIRGCSVRTVYNHLGIHAAIVEPFSDLLPALFAHEISDNLAALTRIASTHDLNSRRHQLECAISIRPADDGQKVEEPKREYGKNTLREWGNANFEKQIELSVNLCRETTVKAMGSLRARTITETHPRNRRRVTADAMAVLTEEEQIEFLADVLHSVSQRVRHAGSSSFFPNLYDRRPA